MSRSARVTIHTRLNGVQSTSGWPWVESGPGCTSKPVLCSVGAVTRNWVPASPVTHTLAPRSRLSRMPVGRRPSVSTRKSEPPGLSDAAKFGVASRRMAGAVTHCAEASSAKTVAAARNAAQKRRIDMEERTGCKKRTSCPLCKSFSCALRLPYPFRVVDPERVSCYFAIATERTSRITVTFTWPGYCISVSIFFEMSCASCSASASVTSVWLTKTRTSRPAWMA